MQSLSDTTFTQVAFNPSSNWTGAQVTGATSSAVYMQSLGNSLTASFPGITTTHSGTAQYIIAGLSPGTYTVEIGGTPVSGSPFTVLSGDSTIFFTSTSGALTIH